MNDKTQPSASTAGTTDTRASFMTLSEHLSRLHEVPAPAGDQGTQADELSNIAVQIDWGDFSAQHPEYKDVFRSGQVSPMTARCQYGLQGWTKPGPCRTVFQWLPDFKGAASTVKPTAQTLNGWLGSGEDTTSTCYYMTMYPADSASPLSPDYGIAYILAYDMDQLPWGPKQDSDYAWCALFQVRVWFRASALLAANNGTNQTAVRNGYAPTPMSVTVTDSVGSMRAVEGLVVTFEIQGEGALFSESGNTTRYCRISSDGRSAAVATERGLAIAPPLQLGPEPGTVTVVASGDRMVNNTVKFTVNVP